MGLMMNKLPSALLVFGLSTSACVLADYTDCNVQIAPASQNYGRIHKDELNFTATDKGQAAALNKRQAQLSVICPQKEAFDISFLGSMTSNGDLTFSDTGKVMLTISNISSDEGALFIKRISGKDISTESVSSLQIYMGDKVKPADASGNTVSMQNFTATLNIEPWVAKSTYSDLANDKTLEGNLTVRIEQP